MTSQADSLALRPSQSNMLPNTWGHLMSETSAQLSMKFEDRDTQLTVDDSALQRRATRMNAVAQRFGKSSPGPSVTAVDVVDAWGYYDRNQSSSESEEAAGRTRIGGMVRGGRGSARETSKVLPSPPGGGIRWRDTATPSPTTSKTSGAAARRGLLTPPSIFEHVSWNARPREVPPAVGGTIPQSFVPRLGREILPPPNMF
jgi:hypothetical protein